MARLKEVAPERLQKTANRTNSANVSFKKESKTKGKTVSSPSRDTDRPSRSKDEPPKMATRTHKHGKTKVRLGGGRADRVEPASKNAASPSRSKSPNRQGFASPTKATKPASASSPKGKIKTRTRAGKRSVSSKDGALLVRTRDPSARKTATKVQKPARRPGRPRKDPIVEMSSSSEGSLSSASSEDSSSSSSASSASSEESLTLSESSNAVSEVSLPKRKRVTHRVTHRVSSHAADKFASQFKDVFELDDVMEPAAAATTGIVNCAVYRPRSEHRRRFTWTPAEKRHLEEGVRKHGEGNWRAILDDPSLSFRKTRGPVDLKDKWRNLKAYVPYKEHPMRQFMLVDAQHEPIRKPSGGVHLYRNRWPRDAALKAATRDEFYPETKDGLRPPFIEIYVKEHITRAQRLSDEVARERATIVHVYRGSRTLHQPSDAIKFSGFNSMWVADVEKLREEKNLDAETETENGSESESESESEDY